MLAKLRQFQFRAAGNGSATEARDGPAPSERTDRKPRALAKLTALLLGHPL
jgi:hypothetical protein